MKRVLLVMAILAVTAVGAAVVYQAAEREREYRELMAQAIRRSRPMPTLAAIEDYSGAIVLRPDSMLAHLRRGETYRQRGDLDDAARDFREASALDPTATRPLEQLGRYPLPAAALQGARSTSTRRVCASTTVRRRFAIESA